MSHMGATKLQLAIFTGMALASSTLLMAPAGAQTWESIPANPRVEIEYRPPTSAQFQSVYESLKERKILEELQHFLAPLNLPHPLRLVTLECGYVNAFYSPPNRSVNICYELVAYIIDGAPKTVSEDGFVTREAAIVGNLVGIVLHEGGHMLFDMLDVPVFGREEDAADETASFIALQFNTDIARTIVKGFAYNWAMEKDPTASAPISVWSDEHGSASQRMFNTLCLAYGGDPKTFQEFVDRGWLPKKRAVHCSQEYTQLKIAFVNTVLPFIDQDLMARVQHTQWLTGNELK
jgi:hypothetical protein